MMRIVTTTESSNIYSFGYDAKAKRLVVIFKSKDAPRTPGAVYEYKNVPEHVPQMMLTCDSVGSFFAKEVRDKYETAKVALTEAAAPDSDDYWKIVRGELPKPDPAAVVTEDDGA